MKQLLCTMMLLLSMGITVTGFAQADDVYTSVDEMPEYPGGMDKFEKYAAKNIRYPKEAVEKEIEGRVWIEFIVETDGSLSNFKVARSIGGGCDEEALRIVKSMPKWKPGKNNGQLVRVSFALPVSFQLPDPSQSKTIEIVEDETEVDEVKVEKADEAQKSEIFTVVENMPEFPGGMAKLSEYLSKNLKYPQSARDSGIQGRVFVNFVIEPDGSVSNVKVMRTLGGGCDEEAIRVVKAMPKWKPGVQRGKAVRVSYILPVNFKP